MNWQTLSADRQGATDGSNIVPAARSTHEHIVDAKATATEQAILCQLAPLPKDLLSARALLRRCDTKFLFSRHKLARVIEQLADSYWILPAAGRAMAAYETLYYDTDDLDLFTQHRRGRRPRYKVRIRNYVDRAVTYLEVKRKNNRNVTDKARRKRQGRLGPLSNDDLAFVSRAAPLPDVPLKPQVWTCFHRITLVSMNHQERATFDVNLTFRRGDDEQRFAGVVIGEAKQERFFPRSPVMLALRSLGVRPFSASKYCSATTVLNPRARGNRFRPVLREMRRVCHA